MKGVHCYEVFGGIALKNHAFKICSIHFKPTKCRANNFSIEFILTLITVVWCLENKYNCDIGFRYVSKFVKSALLYLRNVLMLMSRFALYCILHCRRMMTFAIFGMEKML